MTSGTGGSGAGLMRADVSSKNSPWWSTASPLASARSTCRHSSRRRPRVAGSTPLLLTSLRSSPPTPAPSTRRPGASWLTEASWRAVSSGCRRASRYTPTSREPVAARQRGCRGGEPVEAGAVVKADVIADAHVVEAGRLDHAQQRPRPGGIGAHKAVVNRNAPLAHDDSRVVHSR